MVFQDDWMIWGSRHELGDLHLNSRLSYYFGGIRMCESGIDIRIIRGDVYYYNVLYSTIIYRY